MDAYQKAVLAAKLAGFDGELPLEHASTIPNQWYRDTDVYQAEREAVFGDSWLLACRLDEVSARNAYITTEIAGERLIVARGDDMQLRAFSNVCRHRAKKVVECSSGVGCQFRCRYHGWTYNNKGELRGVPEFGGVKGFRREDHPLPAWEVDTWGPYVFVRAPGCRDRSTLASFLSPLPERCQELELEKLKFVRRVEYDLTCNWKLFVDNYLDGAYHVPTVHPALASRIDYKKYRIECFGNTVVQISPLNASDGSDLSAVRAGNEAYYWWIFPNLMFNIYQGYMDMNLVLPLGPERCRVIFDYFFEKVDGQEKLAEIERSIQVAHQVQLEDTDPCEDVQGGLASRFFNTGRFSVKREAGGYEFHRLLARKLRGLVAE